MGSSPSKPVTSNEGPKVVEATKKSHFLSLPAELRVKVYRELLEPKVIVPTQGVADMEVSEPAIMAVSKLIRQEVEPIFYDNLKFVIDRNNLFESTKDTMRSLDLITDTQLHQIRHYEIQFGGKMNISIQLGSKALPHTTKIEDVPSIMAQGACFHISTTSNSLDCTQVTCATMANSLRDFFHCLVVARARLRICGSIGFNVRPRPTGLRVKASSVEAKAKAKGEKLTYLKRQEVQWLLEWLRFDGKHILREAGLLAL